MQVVFLFLVWGGEGHSEAIHCIETYRQRMSLGRIQEIQRYQGDIEGGQEKAQVVEGDLYGHQCTPLTLKFPKRDNSWGQTDKLKIRRIKEVKGLRKS